MTARGRDESGASAVELVLYMPLLMMAVLLSVQLCLMYLGDQVASAAAREANRVARVTGNEHLARQKARDIIDQIGRGALDRASIDVRRQGDSVTVTVSGHAMHLLPWVPYPRLSETVEGPVEGFRPDTGTGGP